MGSTFIGMLQTLTFTSTVISHGCFLEPMCVMRKVTLSFSLPMHTLIKAGKFVAHSLGQASWTPQYSSIMLHIRDQYSRKVIEEYQRRFEIIPGIPRPPPPPGPNDLRGPDDDQSVEPDLSFGIIGAGAAGLYIGMKLPEVDKILAKYGFKPVKYEILEAESGEHKIGGRLWTHYFTELPLESPNDYYVGVVRLSFYHELTQNHFFLGSRSHAFSGPTFHETGIDLFNELGLQKVKIPYIMTTDDNINLFNSKILSNAQVRAHAQAGNFDPFSTYVKGLAGTVNSMVNYQIDQFRKALVADFDQGWEELMKFDARPTRGHTTTHGAPKTGIYSDQVEFLMLTLINLFLSVSR